MRSVAFLITCLATVSGRCHNDCSSKGVCNSRSSCECFRGYFGPDCSKRICAHGRAFVDSPMGDQNGNGNVDISLTMMKGLGNTPVSEMYSHEYATARSSFQSSSGWDEAHFYRECSNKGICNRESGICECFPGYEGEGCTRIACPDDCSGYGTCKSYEGTEYVAWDKKSSQYCDCDGGYEGVACQNRMCPTGYDPVKSSNFDTSHFQRIAFRGYDSYAYDPADKTSTQTFAGLPYGKVMFTITLTDEFGDEWTTTLMTMLYDVVSSTTLNGPQTKKTKYYVWPRPLNGKSRQISEDPRHTNFVAGSTSINDNFEETVGEHQHKHIAEQVEAALEELPNNVAGDVTVFEAYTFPRVNDADGKLAYGTDSASGASKVTSNQMTGFFTEADFELAACATSAGGGNDYDAVSVAEATLGEQPGGNTCGFGIIGCGVPTSWVDDDAGDFTAANKADSRRSRNGNYDVNRFQNKFQGYCQNSVLPICEKNCDKLGASNLFTNSFEQGWSAGEGALGSGVIRADEFNKDTYRTTLTENKQYFIVDGNPVIRPDSGPEAISAFNDADTKAVVYYMWPHYDNTVKQHLRFPLFYDLDGSTSMHALDSTASHLRENIKHREYLMDNTATSIGSDDIVGLGIYIHFAEQTITTPVRVDYYYSNQFPLLFEQGRGTSSAPNPFKGSALKPKTAAKVKECCTPCSTRDCDKTVAPAGVPKRTVVVTDLTSRRVWDSMFHGREKYFLDSKSSTGSAVGSAKLSSCSKRGLCDYSSGLCSCFAGYSGDNCAKRVAIAY